MHAIARSRFIAAIAATALVLPAVLAARVLVASADDAAGGLDFVGFIHNSELTLPDGTQPGVGDLLLVGADDGLGAVVLYDPLARAALLVDTTSLKQVGAIASVVPRSATTAVDAATDRAYIGTQVSTQGTCGLVAASCNANGTSPQIETLDLAAEESVSAVTLPSWAAGTDVVALAPSATPAGRHVLMALLYEDTSQAGASFNDWGVAHSLTLAAFDEEQLAAGEGDATLWRHDVPECASLMSWSKNHSGATREYLGVDPEGQFVYFGCRGLDEAGATGARFAPSGAMVVDLAAPDGEGDDLPASATGFSDSFYPYGANTKFSISGGDPVHSILEFAISGQGELNKLYVFDAKHRVWTGSMPFVVPANGDESANQNLWGVANDPSTGRAYIYYPTSNVIASEFTQVPVPQGAKLSLGDLAAASSGIFPIVDPGSHQIFLSPGGGTFAHADGTTPYPADDVVAVYRDTRPPPPPEIPDDPDAQTHDIPVTDETPVTYGSFASGYGIKSILVGGLHSMPLFSSQYDRLSPANAENNQCANVNDNGADANGHHVPCDALVPNTSDGDRTFTFGHVKHSEMSNSAASADATTMSMDEATDADGKALSSYNPSVDLWNRFIQPSTGGEPPQAPDGGPSPPDSSSQIAPANCTDFGGDAGNGSGPGASTSCDHEAQQTSAAAASDLLAGPEGASAQSDPAVQASPVQVAYAGAATVVSHTEDNEALTAAKAVARDISLAVPGGPTVTIGEVTAEATSAAAGHPGTALSTFERKVRNVVVRDPSGKPVFSCGFAGADETACDPRQLTDAVSAQSPSPVLFLMPDPDPAARATPGGAQAEVIKSKYQYWNDYFTNADNSVEVPGLQIIVIGDQDQPSRVVLSLAGVHVESHDAIGLPPPPLPDLPNPGLALALVDGSTPPVPLAGGEFTITRAAGSVADLPAVDGAAEDSPSPTPSDSPSASPSSTPSDSPSASPSSTPSESPSDLPSPTPSDSPSASPTATASPSTGASPSGGTSAEVPTSLTCTTGADGIGNCVFADLEPGTYTVSQTKAPPGYAAADDYPLTLDAGQDYVAVFVNLEAIGSVHVTLASAVDQSPLPGGRFALYAGSKTLGTPVATCATGKSGGCGFDRVPLGDYTMSQTAAPKGFLTSDAVPFSLTDPGQAATLAFVDGTPGARGGPAERSHPRQPSGAAPGPRSWAAPSGESYLPRSHTESRPPGGQQRAPPTGRRSSLGCRREWLTYRHSLPGC